MWQVLGKPHHHVVFLLVADLPVLKHSWQPIKLGLLAGCVVGISQGVWLGLSQPNHPGKQVGQTASVASSVKTVYRIHLLPCTTLEAAVQRGFDRARPKTTNRGDTHQAPGVKAFSQTKQKLFAWTLAEAMAVQQDQILRLQHPVVPCCLTFTAHAAGLQQNWQHVSAVRLQVQEVQRQVQPMQLSPIWSVVMVLASQPREVAHPLIASHTALKRCAFCSIITCFACAVVVQGRPMLY